MKMRDCEVNMNDSDCTFTTQAECYRCGRPACVGCSQRLRGAARSVLDSLRNPIRICRDCVNDEPQHVQDEFKAKEARTRR